MTSKPLIEEVLEGVYLIRGINNSSHVYLIVGQYKNVLIDTGMKGNFPHLVEGLTKVGLRVSDIDLVINTHEHFDHVGGNLFFHETAIIAAHRFAATKIELQDEYVVHAAIHGHEIIKTKFHLWLENRTLFDLGNFKLKIFHTPGHTSGCICIYEPSKKFMFTGDTIFAGGTISKISDSGSFGDYINSLERINTFKIETFLPGHGKICHEPENALKVAIKKAKNRLETYKKQLIRDKIKIRQEDEEEVHE